MKLRDSGEEQAKRDFIKGRTNSVSIKPKKGGLGFSPVQETASGAGTHGGSKKQRNKKDRSQAKRELKDY